MTEKSLTQEAAEFVAGVDYACLPLDVLRRAKEAVLEMAYRLEEVRDMPLDRVSSMYSHLSDATLAAS